MKVLGIESSCDETGVAIYDSTYHASGESSGGFISERLHSQIDTHAIYGGVVPELASRDHLRYLAPMVYEVLQEANISASDLDAIAYTAGPGLAGALFVGAGFATSFAYSINKPAIKVHHMEAHLLAILTAEPAPQFPFLALLVSGGHTQILAARGYGDYELLGETVDDAVGEAFDKVATMLELAYPGGPAVEQLALGGDVSRYRFPRPMLKHKNLNFSFSGLKTHVRDFLIKHENAKKADIAIAFETAVADTLTTKCRLAVEQTGIKRLVIAGGVAANKRLRDSLTKASEQHDFLLYTPPLKLCTDNGAMIAFAGFLRYMGELNHCRKSGINNTENLDFSVKARWPITELTPFNP